MITASISTRQPARWQQSLRTAITDPAELLDILDLDSQLLEPAQRAAQRFALKVPRGFVARMRRGDAADPLLRQILPLGVELEEAAGFSSDPVGDLASRARPGVLHKYRGRALLITTGACAVHCRYCFRREFPYADNLATTTQWEPALQALRGDASIAELILSGGDPLSLADHKLRALTDALPTVRHLRRLRIHTRFPVVLPERVDDGLLAWLRSIRLPVIVVVHANHANEIDASVETALASLAACGVTLLNQSVLLRGINDSAEALIALSERLFAAGTLPYYLHLLDRVHGAAHFDVAEDQARVLMREVAGALPGYLVPRLVREEAGMPFKTPLGW